MTFLDRLKMQLSGYVYTGHKTRPGWRGSLPFYRFTCTKHGEVENYPQGYAEILRCPECDKENWR